jgi:hypothetical protein
MNKLTIIIIIISIIFIFSLYDNQEKLDINDITNRYNSMYKIIPLENLDNISIQNDLFFQYKSYFEIKEIFNPIYHLTKAISVSLFCKNVNNTYPDEYKEPSRDTNSEWYNKYYKNLLNLINDKKYILPDYKIRIYLENKLSDLKDELTNEFTEIYIMKSNSIGAQPGMLWRFMAFDDKSLDIAFCMDVDESLKDNLKFIKIFEEYDKTLGRFMGDISDCKIYKNNDDSALNYIVVDTSKIGIRPNKTNISFIHYILLFTLLIFNRSISNKPWTIYDDEKLTLYNKPFNEKNICWGCNIFLYGFDEKIWKHVFFPYFSEKNEVLTFTFNNINVLRKLNNNNPFKIDYDFTKFYDNPIVELD